MKWGRGVAGAHPRRLLAIALFVLALGSAILTALGKLNLPNGSALTGLFVVLGAALPVLQTLLEKHRQTLDREDEQAEKDTKRAAERARVNVLQQVRRFWVQTELGSPAEGLPLIELGLAERPGAVQNLLRALLRRPTEQDRILESGTQISMIYKAMGGQLLILGDPGAGKTTLLLQLAQNLLDEAERSVAEPIPVVFHLSTWAIEQLPLAVWLVDELQKRYGVARRLGQMWVNDEQIIPLLDGLDEVPAHRRQSCLKAINDFRDEHGQLPLVVCSRINEYEDLQARLNAGGAIVIQPLARADVERYLQQAGRQVASVRIVLRNDDRLWELLTTPLLVGIVIAAYRGKRPTAIRTIGNMEERRRQVLAAYVAAMLERPSASTVRSYSSENVVSWLVWLARAMRTHGQSVFYLDWMQPDWLPRSAQRWRVTFGLAAGIGLGFGLSLALIVSRDVGIIAGLAVGTVCALVVGLAAYDPSIAPTEPLRWSWPKFRRNLPHWLVIGLVIALVAALAVGLVVGIGLAVVAELGGGRIDTLGFTLVAEGHSVVLGALIGLVVGLVIGLSLGLGVGIAGGLSSGFETKIYAVPPAPGQAIRTSKRNALVLLIVLGAGLGGPLFFVLSVDQGIRLAANGLIELLVLLSQFGLVPGLIVGLALGLARREESASLADESQRSRSTRRQRFLGVLAAGLGTWLAGGLILALASNPISILASTLAIASAISLRRGGGAYLRHHVLRWTLISHGLMPRDPASFLEYGTKLVLLRRRGGGYQFLHSLLLEYFVGLELHAPKVS